MEIWKVYDLIIHEFHLISNWLEWSPFSDLINSYETGILLIRSPRKTWTSPWPELGEAVAALGDLIKSTPKRKADPKAKAGAGGKAKRQRRRRSRFLFFRVRTRSGFCFPQSIGFRYSHNQENLAGYFLGQFFQHPSNVPTLIPQWPRQSAARKRCCAPHALVHEWVCGQCSG